MNINLIISNEQTKIIAQCIYKDIASYIDNHKKDYELWLLQKGENNE